MKTRKEVKQEILAQHQRHSAKEQTATLEYALDVMSDAHFFSLAQDLQIDLETNEVRS